MDWTSIIVAIFGTLFGGGIAWVFTFHSMKVKAEGEATVAEADGWKAQQDVYQQTIADLKESCDFIRQDRNLLREENSKLREENTLLREKINNLELQISDLRKEIARQGRKLAAIDGKKKKGESE